MIVFILSFLIISFLLFIIGAILGSFLNVYIYRSVRSESWVAGRSKCESCKNIIAWYDNIPLLSYLLLGRKCRHCKKRIPLIHPVIETLTGVLFVWWYWGGSFFFHLSQEPMKYLQPLFWLGVAILLLVIFFADLLYFIIPDLAVLGLLFLTVFYRIFLTYLGVMQSKDLYLSIIITCIFTIFFASLWFFTKGKGFGFGDVKLIIPLSLLLGWPKIMVGVFTAFLVGAIVGLVLITFGKRQFGQHLPFAPFLISSTFFALLWGERIWQWYMSLI